MSSQTDRDTARTVVKTYVPAYQREKWDDHAEELGMSRSEFVRTMVQAGRRGFGAEAPAEGVDGESDTGGDSGIGADDPLRGRVVESLDSRGPLSWDELREAVAGNIEGRIERVLDDLQEEGRVRHSGRQGGYVLESDE